MLTGQAPHNAGMLGLTHRGFGLNDPGQHLATTLADSGYETVIAGFQHVTQDNPSVLGYTTVLDRTDFHARSVMRDAANWLEKHVSSGSSKPFFLDAGTFEAHRVFPELPPGAGRFVRPLQGLPDAPETRHDTARFQAGIADFDRALGTMLETVDRLDLADSTIVICTTDHGPPFPRMKCNLNNAGTGIMLIMRGPGPWRGGRTVDQLVSNIDIYPTLCDLADIERPAWLQGVSIEPLARDAAKPVRSEHFSEVTYHAAYEPMRGIRTERWTLIRRFSDWQYPVLPNCDDGESRDLLVNSGWPQRPVDRLQLYDNMLDPLNTNNLSGDAEFALIVDDLTARLERWMVATDDPLLLGDVPLPPGGFANPVDGDSPEGVLMQMTDDGQLVEVKNPGTQF